MFLTGRLRLFGLDGCFVMTARQRTVPADTVDMGIVQNGKQPGAQITAAAKTLPLLEGPHQRIMHQIFSIVGIAHQRTCITPERCKLSDNVKWAFFPFHD
jgi:hypothetical protein